MTWAEDNLILRVVGGSHAYGLATETSDIDQRGVALPPVSWLVGFPPPETTPGRPQSARPKRTMLLSTPCRSSALWRSRATPTSWKFSSAATKQRLR